MRNEDLQWIDEQLYQWAKWSRQNGDNLGYPTPTAEARVKKLGLQGATTQMTASRTEKIYMPSEIECIEKAILKLKNSDYQDVIKAKYLQFGKDEDRAMQLSIDWGKSVKVTAFRDMSKKAMMWLDGYVSAINECNRVTKQ